jgi:hypothetical protein
MLYEFNLVIQRNPGRFRSPKRNAKAGSARSTDEASLVRTEDGFIQIDRQPLSRRAGLGMPVIAPHAESGHCW